MALTSQIELIEQLLAQKQTAILPALKALFIQSHHSTALAHCDLAWAHLRAHQDTAALQHLQQALQIEPDCSQAMDGLCQAYWQLGDLAAARRWGRAALTAKDAQSVAASPRPVQSKVAKEGTHAQGALQVVAFSLFGQEAFYSEAAVRNAADVARLYPGWQCRFYVGPEVSAPVRTRLTALGAEVVTPPIQHAHLPGTTWRFLAIDDPAAQTVLFRDADSQITQREVRAVSHWLALEASNYNAHVMRDHLLHSELILAGLWGTHCKPLRGMGQALNQFFATPRHSTHGDQHFLREWVWPRVRSTVMQHDGAFGWSGPNMASAAAFDPPQIADETDKTKELKEDHVGHAPTQTLTLQLPSSSANPCPLTLTRTAIDGSRIVLGEYLAVHLLGHCQLRLPPSTVSGVQRGEVAFTTTQKLSN